jgi:hypothetical protein
MRPCSFLSVPLVGYQHHSYPTHSISFHGCSALDILNVCVLPHLVLPMSRPITIPMLESFLCFVLFYTILAISLREHSSRTKSGTPDLFTLLFKYHQEAFWIVHQARSPAFGKQYMRMACSVGAQKQGQDAEKQLEAFCTIIIACIQMGVS